MKKSAIFFVALAALIVLVVGVFARKRSSQHAEGADPAGAANGPGAVVEDSSSKNPPIARRISSRVPRSLGVPAQGSAHAPDTEAPFEELMSRIRDARTKTDPDFEAIASILKRALDELTVSERAEALNALAVLVAERDLEPGFQILRVLDEFRDRHLFVKAAVEEASQRDPRRAAEWASKLPEPALTETAYNAIGMKWGRTNLEASLAWANGLSDATLRLSAFEGVTWAWAQNDSNATYEWAAKIPEADIRDKVFVKLAKMVSTQEPRRGAEWALKFPEGPGRTEALDYAVFHWAGKDLKAAAEWASGISDARLLEGSLVAVARSWSNSDPRQATEWAAQLPDSPARTSALITTARKWAEANPAAAAEWIGAQAQSPARVDVFKGVTSALANSRPATAEAWMSHVVDPGLRAAGEQVFALRQEDPAPQPGPRNRP